MENHTFADAVPSPDHSDQPCWKVAVHRKGVSEPVGCLEVHHSNFPPRKKKTKILWKLPSSLDDPPPRFGGHEKERLWEMFKQQKKERRKSKKSILVVDEADVQQLAADLEDAQLASPEKPDSPTAAPPPPGFGNPSTTANATTTTTTTTSNPPKETSQTTATASVSPGSNGHRSQQQQLQSSSQEHPKIQPMQASVLQQQQSIPPPPPGISLQQQQQPQQPSIPQSPTSALYFVFGNLTATQLAALPPSTLSSLVGNHVAQCLIHSLITPGQLPIWLAHYSASATKVLLFQTAQAVAQTAYERQQQWESLILASTPATPSGAPPAWDCQGWTVQTIDTHKTNNTTTISNATNDHTIPHAPSLLVVLTGRTMQRQEILTYHETLILHPTTMTTTTITSAAVLPTEPVRYQIHNDVLSLTRAAV